MYAVARPIPLTKHRTPPSLAQWLSMEEVADIVAPPKAHVEAVIEWVSAATGVPSYDVRT